jgi:hypothetical protein
MRVRPEVRLTLARDKVAAFYLLIFNTKLCTHVHYILDHHTRLISIIQQMTVSKCKLTSP